MDKTICELFAGVGGFRLGFEKSNPNWQTVWFSQWEPSRKSQWAYECYVSHWDKIDNNTGIDITKVNKVEIPNHNLLVGGFPCQDYSVAQTLSNSKGIEGKKGVLWWQIRDILEIKKSPFGLFENVDRLLKSPASQRGRDFGVMLACLADLNYSVEWRIINAAEYGAAQRRRRIFIFIYKNNTKFANKQSSILPIDIIKKEGFFAKTFKIENNDIDIKECDLNYKDIKDVSDNFTFNFENAGYMINGKIYTAKVEAIKEEPILLKDILEKDVDEKYFLTNDKIEKIEYLKGAKKIERVSKTGHKYVFSEGPVPFPDPIDKPARTMLTTEGTVNRSTHIIKDPTNDKLRIITPLEAERIQGFDDSWTNIMPERTRYFCMGNALVVPIITRMAKHIEEIFNFEK